MEVFPTFISPINNILNLYSYPIFILYLFDYSDYDFSIIYLFFIFGNLY